MADSYEHDVTASMLLHDMSRIFIDGGVSLEYPSDGAKDRVQGPVERVFGAVQNYYETDFAEDPDMEQWGDSLALVEHSMWQEVCAELTRLGVDVNGEERLNALMCQWGEDLVALRVSQGSQTRSTARLRATEKVEQTAPPSEVQIDDDAEVLDPTDPPVPEE